VPAQRTALTLAARTAARLGRHAAPTTTRSTALLRALDGALSCGRRRAATCCARPAILPTGRNMHGFDPFRHAQRLRGAATAPGRRERLLDRHVGRRRSPFPESIAHRAVGHRQPEERGRTHRAGAGADRRARRASTATAGWPAPTLIPLAELGRPRIDVVMTLSGIFRDLLPLQIKLLAEAASSPPAADEPAERNFVRKHALAYQARARLRPGDRRAARLRQCRGRLRRRTSTISIDNSRWDDEDELAETYTRRKGFAYGRSGAPAPAGRAAAERAGRRGR
jgi:magnesium chelatase subunit H